MVSTLFPVCGSLFWKALDLVSIFFNSGVAVFPFAFVMFFGVGLVVEVSGVGSSVTSSDSSTIAGSSAR